MSASTVAMVLALALVPYFIGLGAPALWDANEPLYAQPPKEIVEGGSALAPTCNGVVYYPHPPLATWLTVPSYWAFGATAFGHRVPMALLASMTVLAVFAFGRRVGGTGVGLVAAVVLAGTPRFWLFARQLPGDVVLTALLTCAYLCALPTLAGQPARGRWYAAKALVGVACLAKGPIAIVLYAGTVFLTWMVARPRVPFRTLAPVSSALVVLLCGAPWFVWMSLTYADFGAEFFGRYNLARAAGDLGSRGPLYYLVALLGDAQPWILLVPSAVHLAARSRDRSAGALLPWVGVGFTLCLFTLSAGKRNVYLLPIYPLLGVALAPLIVSVWRGEHPRVARIGAVVLGVAGLVAAALALRLHDLVPDLAPEIFVLVAVLVCGGALGIAAATAGRARLLVSALLIVPLLLEVAVAVTFPALDRYRPIPRLMAEVRKLESRADPEPFVVFSAKYQSPRFYLGRPTRLASSPDELRGHLQGRDRAFILADAKDVNWLMGGLPELRFEEVARGSFLRFNFRLSILGEGETTSDVVVFLATGRVDPRPPLPRGGCE